MTKRKLKVLYYVIYLLFLQAAVHILAHPLSVNSWLQQQGVQWWWFPALSLGVRAHSLAASVFANLHSSASPAHTATTTTQPLHQPQQEPLVWMICLNRRQEVRPVLKHRYCFSKKRNKGRSSLAAFMFLLDWCGYVSMLSITHTVHFEAFQPIAPCSLYSWIVTPIVYNRRNKVSC